MRLVGEAAVGGGFLGFAAGGLDEIEDGLEVVGGLAEGTAGDDDAAAAMAFALVIEGEFDFGTDGERPLGEQAYAFGRPLDLLPDKADRVRVADCDWRGFARPCFSLGSHIHCQ